MPLYPVSSSVYYSPAKQLEQERAAEEQKIREQYTAQLAAAERDARAKFEADLAAKRAVAWAEFETGLTAQKDKSTFQGDLSSQESAARSAFESQLAAERQRSREAFQVQIGLRRGELVEAPLRAAKREYAMTYKRQMLPRYYRAIRSGAEETFKGLAEAEQEAFEQRVSVWETGETKTLASEIESWKSLETGKQQQAVKEWETSQRSDFEKMLGDWEKEQRASFEYHLTGEFGWKQTAQAQLEIDIEQWRKAWQPKGFAERMMDIKIPSLDLGGKLSAVLGVKPSPYAAVTPMDLAYKPSKAEFAPLALPAGIVASVESLVYGVGQLAGLPTPRMPPTLTGGLVGSGLESIGKGQLTASEELQRINKMEPAYVAGTVLGDILVSYGIGKAVKAGTKAVRGVAGFLYEESGLKYSHVLYEAKELSLKISEHLPKSPTEAIRESDLAYELSRAGRWIKGKLPLKLMEVPAEGIVGLPTLEEEVPQKAVLAFAEEGVKASKALETATGIGLTPLEYGKALYPKIFAGMELLGWTEAPKAAGFGLTVGREAAPTIAKSALSEALAETMWIGAGAGERWAVRAGVIPSPEDVIVQPPKEAGEQMIKGGKYIDLDVTRALGFSRFPYKEAAVGKFFFEKEKLPSFKDLLKGTKAEATLSQLFEAPTKIIKPILPELAMLPQAAGKISVSEAIGIGAVLGLKPLGRARLKPEAIVKPSPLAAEIPSIEVKTVAAQEVKVEQVSLLKEMMAPAQLLKTLSVQKGIFKPLPPLKPPKKKEEPLPRIKRVAMLGKKPKRKMAGYLYPVLPERKVPKYLRIGLELPRAKRGKPMSSASSFILGKRRTKNVFKQKVRHKRK